jgi:hypothetical protein
METLSFFVYAFNGSIKGARGREGMFPILQNEKLV